MNKLTKNNNDSYNDSVFIDIWRWFSYNIYKNGSEVMKGRGGLSSVAGGGISNANIHNSTLKQGLRIQKQTKIHIYKIT